MITDNVEEIWEQLGTFWSDFPDKDTFTTLWSEYKNVGQELQRRNSQIYLSRFLEHSPSMFEYRYETFKYKNENLIGSDKLPTGLPYIYSIPNMKGVETEETLTEDVDYEITNNSRIKFLSTPTLQNEEVTLYAENVYAYNLVDWKIFGKSVGLDISSLRDRDYLPFFSLPADDLEQEKMVAKHYKYLLWALWSLKRSTPTIKNLKRALGIVYGLPFTYTSGNVTNINGRDVTIGDYTYEIPSKFIIDVSEGDSVEKFQLLATDCYYDENLDTVSNLKKNSTVEFEIVGEGDYNSTFVEDYFETIIPDSITYTLNETGVSLTRINGNLIYTLDGEQINLI